MRVASLHRYPVKGLSPEPLSSVELEKGRFFPCDRLFAFENGRSSFDPAAPAYQPKTRFLMLMKNARLAELADELGFDLSSTDVDAAAAAGVSMVVPRSV